VSSRPSIQDLLIAAAFTAMTLAESVFSDTTREPLVHALLTVPVTVALAWRRRFPLPITVGLAVSIVATNPEGLFTTFLATVLMAYTAGAEREGVERWAAVGVLLSIFALEMLFGTPEPSDVAAALVFVLGPAGVGAALRHRSHRAADALARVERLERERETETAAAAAEERARIARELHDIVSHSISVIAIQTQAVRRRLGAEQTREAEDLAAVETTARQALAEMRRLFGVLRTEGSHGVALAPQPGLGELGRLLDQVRASGLPVELQVEGEPTELPPGVDLAGYRIVQEGLTNTLRHAGASRAIVTLRYGETDLEVVVDDDGRGANGGFTGGHGLLGIRERVALYGGSVHEGAPPGGGFRLAARLPVRERT
jgi:signal transduction histidine kinase